MCMSSPKMPEPPAPPPPPPDPQEAKAADASVVRKKGAANAPIAAGTLLTGPSGIATNQLKTTGGSLLGG